MFNLKFLIMNSKIISLRVPNHLLKCIELYTDSLKCCGRSFIITKLLEVVFDCAEPNTIREMLAKRYPREKGFVIRFEVEKGKIAERLEAEKADKT